MKPTKKVAAKRPAKRKPAKRAVRRGSIEHKLMQLWNRIDESYTSPNDVSDKDWVWKLVEDIQKNKFTKLSREDGLKCNELWRQYA